MKKMIKEHTLELKTGDITKEKVDAIVNAANGYLMGGGGVDGAIHRAAGKALLEACKTVRNKELSGKRLATGEAVITDGYNLPASYVIHTVGPIWDSTEKENESLLSNCYQNALSLAAEKKLESICFPSISTGIYRFPVDRAAEIAVRTITQFLLEQHAPMHVTMVLFSKKDYEMYVKALDEVDRRM